MLGIRSKEAETERTFMYLYSKHSEILPNKIYLYILYDLSLRDFVSFRNSDVLETRAIARSKAEYCHLASAAMSLCARNKHTISLLPKVIITCITVQRQISTLQ